MLTVNIYYTEIVLQLDKMIVFKTKTLKSFNENCNSFCIICLLFFVSSLITFLYTLLHSITFNLKPNLPVQVLLR